MTVLTADSLTKRYEEAAASPKVWEMGVCAAMRHFHLPHHMVKAARASYLRQHNDEVSSVLMEKVRQESRNRLVRAEVRYPGILRGLITGTAAQMGRRFRLTRSATNRIAGHLREFAREIKMGVEGTVELLSREAREFDGPPPKLGRPPKSRQEKPLRRRKEAE